MSKYIYNVVAGAVVYAPDYKTLPAAKARAIKMRAEGGDRWPWNEVEVERCERVGISGYRFWRWRDGAWTTEFWREASADDLAHWQA